ncbi:alpha/beta fold hydrolase, partial [Mammaliicoccus sciuri]
MLNHHVKSYDEQKPSIILLHGFISDHTSFHIVESTLRNKGLNVITIDLPGHGHDKSSYDEIWSMDFIVSKIKEVIDYLELDKIYLHGYSMGGRVALSFAVQYSELLSGLILESASPGLKDSSDKQNRIEVDYNRATRIQEIGLQ